MPDLKKPEFDPNKPFELAPKPEFDPNKPFETIKTETPSTFKDSLSSANKYVGETVAGAIAGGKEMLPFSEATKKGVAGAGAASESVYDLFRSPEKQKSFKEHYKEILDTETKQRKEAIDKAPIAAFLGGLATLPLSMALPVPGAGISGASGILARVAGNAGLSALDQGTSGEKLFDPEKAKQAATLGGGLQSAFEAIPALGKVAKASGLTDLAGNVASKAGKYLDDLGATKAVKAAFGNTEKAWRSIPADETKQIGKNLLTPYEDIKPVVGFLSTPDKIETAAVSATQKIAEKMQPIHAEATANNILVDGGDIAGKLIDRASKIPDTEINKSAINLYQKIALEMEHRGKITLDEAQALKDSYIYKEADPRIKELGKDVINNVNRALTETMKDTVKASNLPDKNKYADLVSRYDSYTAAANAIHDVTRQANKNSGYGIRDAILTTAGATAGGFIGGGGHRGVESLIGGALLGIGSKLARSRGDAGLASAANRLGAMFEKSPELVSRYSNVLKDAIQKGPAGFAAAHAMLMEHDPNYKNIVENSDIGNPNVFERKMQQMQPGNR